MSIATPPPRVSNGSDAMRSTYNRHGQTTEWVDWSDFKQEVVFSWTAPRIELVDEVVDPGIEGQDTIAEDSGQNGRSSSTKDITARANLIYAIFGFSLSVVALLAVGGLSAWSLGASFLGFSGEQGLLAGLALMVMALEVAMAIHWMRLSKRIAIAKSHDVARRP